MKKSIIIILSVFAFFMTGCAKEKPIKIAISKAIGSKSYETYSEWIKKYSNNIETINLYGLPIDSAKRLINQCDGVILSGGPDVNPQYYSKPQDSSLCEIDNYRDSLEFAIIEQSFKFNKPILAICRGLQILNVAKGGSLIADLPTQRPSNIIHRCELPDTCFHFVKFANSHTISYASNNTYKVNTNHHQGIDKLSSEFRAVAFSDDSLIEAFEPIDASKYHFIFAVQWHPERLNDPVVSDSIAVKFIRKIQEINK